MRNIQGNVVDINPKTLMVEITGPPEKIDAVVNVLALSELLKWRDPALLLSNVVNSRITLKKEYTTVA